MAETMVQIYIDELYRRLAAVPSFPAALERSTIRAFTRDEKAVLVIARGAEEVLGGSPFPMADRVREIQCVIHTVDDGDDAVSDSVFVALQPVVMQLAGAGLPGLTDVVEHGTDEPRFVKDKPSRKYVAKRFRLFYRSLQDSLTE
jgi:hypothetical protein